jgi:hypothetical protein
MSYTLDDYEPVDDRIHAFYKAHPRGRITTRLEHHRFDERGLVDVVVSAAVYREDTSEPAGTGLAYEHRTERGVNAIALLENAETSCIGRALAACGYSTKGKRPSREEMTRVVEAAPQTTGGTPVVAGAEGVAAGTPLSSAVTPSPSPTIGEAVGNVLEAMPGSRIIDQHDTPPPASRGPKGSPKGAGRVANPDAPVSPAQLGLIRKRIAEIGITDPKEAGALVVETVGRPVARAEDLTKGEASKLIDRLLNYAAAQEQAAIDESREDPWAGQEPGW